MKFLNHTWLPILKALLWTSTLTVKLTEDTTKKEHDHSTSTAALFEVG